jgi:hypothetical protein
MKPFATLGSEISKVRDRVRRGAESLHPARVAGRVAGDVRDQRDRLLAKLGEQTFRLIAERKLVVPKMLQDSVERLASLLGVQLPQIASRGPSPSSLADTGPASAPLQETAEREAAPVVEAVASNVEILLSEPAKEAAPPAIEATPAPAATKSPSHTKKKRGKKSGKR